MTCIFKGVNDDDVEVGEEDKEEEEEEKEEERRRKRATKVASHVDVTLCVSCKD